MEKLWNLIQKARRQRNTVTIFFIVLVAIARNLRWRLISVHDILE